jgi:hypothetical protein
MSDINVKVLDQFVGKTLKAVEGMTEGSGEVVFRFTDGTVYQMHHHQDCCEHVELEDVIGDPDDLLHTPLFMAVESTNAQDCKGDESCTWTFYRLGTIKGTVVLRWYGSSNGYYSESVDIDEVPYVPTQGDKIRALPVQEQTVVEWLIGNGGVDTINMEPAAVAKIWGDYSASRGDAWLTLNEGDPREQRMKNFVGWMLRNLIKAQAQVSEIGVLSAALKLAESRAADENAKFQQCMRDRQQDARDRAKSTTLLAKFAALRAIADQIDEEMRA